MGILLSGDAGAAGAAGEATGSFLVMILVYVAMFGALYFFFFRPQRKQQKQLAAMQAAVEVGDVILTTSGFYGVVIDVTDDMVIVEFGSNKNCRIPMEKSAISRVEKPGESQ